ncbi:MAG: SoxR reducing system RseC family protein [Bacteroidales bacterium]|jgi:sigma-E factor negative regulatory protein RseC|nr:SoxR reducing system RseC family protein [Bacteroidales bacterium]
MNFQSSHICHSGIVERISDNFVDVSIVSESACSGCHAQSVCNVGDMEEKSIRVFTSKSWTYSRGETVSVSISQQKGFEALFYGYLLPFLVVFISLLIFLQFTTELYAGVYSLMLLIPYYLLLYVNKQIMRSRFSFQIERIK